MMMIIRRGLISSSCRISSNISANNVISSSSSTIRRWITTSTLTKTSPTTNCINNTSTTYNNIQYHNYKRYYSSSSKEETDLLKELFQKDETPESDPTLKQNRIFIQTENTPNPDSLKFLPGVGVMEEGGTVDFPDFKSSQISPLANAIFKLDGVNRVFFGPNFISVNKFTETEWSILKPQVYGAIINFYHSGQPLLFDKASAENSDTLILPEDDEVVAMIKELIETRIRPTLIDDGGNIQYLGFKDGIVLVKLQGTCSSCSSSQATLKGGIERMLMHWISEVRGIMAVTDDELDKLNLDYFNQVEKEKENGGGKN